MTLFNNIARAFYSCDGLKGIILNQFFTKNKKQRESIIGESEQIISIILPVLNSEKTIEGAIKSIQSQTYPHWELIIVDDGSTDNTPKTIAALAQQDSRIKIYINQSNQGVAYARNIGLFYATGSYITFHDADDTSHPERFEYQVAALLSSLKTMLSIFQYVRVNGQDDIFIINGKKKWNRVSGMMFKKEVVEQIGYFKPLKISEDSEYYERIVASYGKQARKISCKTLYYALFSPDSLLFSNANVRAKGNRIDYQIHDKELKILNAFRWEHQKIKAGEQSPYQGFTPNNEITTCDKS